MRHLTKDQIEKLCLAAESDLDRLLYRVCYEHGLRISEALSLTPARLQNGRLVTKPGKHGRPTIQKVAPELLELWNRVTAGVAQRDRVFPFTRQWAGRKFTRTAKLAGIDLAPRQGIHTLRHSIAHHMLDANAPLPVIQRKLGHASIASTGCYLRADDSEVDAWSERALA